MRGDNLIAAERLSRVAVQPESGADITWMEHQINE